MNVALWTIQGLLAVAFLAQAVIKFVLPEGLPDTMSWVYDIPRFPNIIIGVLEVLGAAGLILPGVTRIQPRLIPIAAAGLMLTMVGAAIFHISRGETAQVPLNAIIFVLAGFVAYGRLRLYPIAART